MSENKTTWWLACRYRGIREFEIQKITDSTITPKDGRRENRDSSYTHWRATRQEALAAILEDFEQDIKNAKAMVQWRAKALEEYKAKYQ